MTQYTIFTSALNDEVAIWCISNINKNTDSILIKQYKNFIIMSLKLNSHISMGRYHENKKILSIDILELWCILLQEYKDVSTINNSKEKSLLVTNMSWNDIKSFLRSILDLPNLGN
jgi:hypothetical protein